MRQQGSISGERTEAPRFVVLADDLTGACDAVVPFALCGLEAEVFPRGFAPMTSRANAISFSTNTRDVGEEEMRERLQAVMPSLLQGKHQVVKKIDSVFRGNTFAEIALTEELAGDRLVAIVPAFPSAGRTCVGGEICIDDISGKRYLPLLTPLEERGCKPLLIEAGRPVDELREEIAGHVAIGQKSFLFDAACQEDIERTVDALQSLSQEVLWIGSAGLTRALAQSLPCRVAENVAKSRQGSVLFLIGSDHPVTQAQIDQLRQKHVVALHSGAGEPSRIPLGDSMLYQIQRGVTTPEELARDISTLNRQSLACLFVTGGDTASLLCDALSIDRLRITDEFAPGVPVGMICDGAMSGMPIILKSGGFGETDLLLRIVKTYTTKELN